MTHQPDRDFTTDDDLADAFQASFEHRTGLKLPQLRENTPPPWWEQQDCLKLRLEPGETMQSQFESDTIILKTITSEEMYALVPTRVLPPSRNYVPVEHTGYAAGKLIIDFPYGSEGWDTWCIPADQYNQLVSQETPPAPANQGDPH